MELNYKVYGQGRPIIILHGLFGSLDNWATIGRKLGEEYMVYLVDQRDHGKSPHTDTFNYDVLAEDLRVFMEENWMHEAVLIGHSMGGKTVMRFALDNEDMVDKLIVLDMAPKQYPNRHQNVFDAMKAIDLDALEHRKDAGPVLLEKLDGDNATTAFLLKNILREKDGGFRWKMNVELLEKEYDHIVAPMPTDYTFEGPTLFVKGTKSSYITEQDETLIHSLFPLAEIGTIDAGHWLHAEKPEELMLMIKKFVELD